MKSLHSLVQYHILDLLITLWSCAWHVITALVAMWFTPCPARHHSSQNSKPSSTFNDASRSFLWTTDGIKLDETGGLQLIKHRRIDAMYRGIDIKAPWYRWGGTHHPYTPLEVLGNMSERLYLGL